MQFVLYSYIIFILYNTSYRSHGVASAPLLLSPSYRVPDLRSLDAEVGGETSDVGDGHLAVGGGGQHGQLGWRPERQPSWWKLAT
jgi:hypothetical protein